MHAQCRRSLIPIFKAFSNLEECGWLVQPSFLRDGSPLVKKTEMKNFGISRFQFISSYNHLFGQALFFVPLRKNFLLSEALLFAFDQDSKFSDLFLKTTKLSNFAIEKTNRSNFRVRQTRKPGDPRILKRLEQDASAISQPSCLIRGRQETRISLSQNFMQQPSYAALRRRIVRSPIWVIGLESLTNMLSQPDYLSTRRPNSHKKRLKSTQV